MALITSKKVQASQNQTITLQDSKTLTRNLVRMGIGSIAYLRGLFPESCFTNRMIAGMPIKTLTTNTADSEQLVKLIEEGILEAMKYDLLQAIFLDVHEGDEADESEKETTLIESYQFKISSPVSEEDRGPEPSRKEVQDRIAAMMRQISVITAVLQPLPECKTIVIKLVYHVDAQPDTLSLPFFHPGEDYFNAEEEEPDGGTFVFGEINTRYHLMRVQLKAVRHEEASSSRRSQSSGQQKREAMDPLVLKALKPLRYVTCSILQDRFGFPKEKCQRLLSELQALELIGPSSRWGHEVIKDPHELDTLIQYQAKGSPEFQNPFPQSTLKRSRVHAPSPTTSLQLGIETPPLKQFSKQKKLGKKQRY
jgi:hypothetical protein